MLFEYFYCKIQLLSVLTVQKGVVGLSVPPPPPQTYWLKYETPVPQNVTLFGNRVVADVIS